MDVEEERKKEKRCNYLYNLNQFNLPKGKEKKKKLALKK